MDISDIKDKLFAVYTVIQTLDIMTIFIWMVISIWLIVIVKNIIKNNQEKRYNDLLERIYGKYYLISYDLKPWFVHVQSDMVNDDNVIVESTEYVYTNEEFSDFINETVAQIKSEEKQKKIKSKLNKKKPL